MNAFHVPSRMLEPDYFLAFGWSMTDEVQDQIFMPQSFDDSIVMPSPNPLDATKVMIHQKQDVQKQCSEKTQNGVWPREPTCH